MTSWWAKWTGGDARRGARERDEWRARLRAEIAEARARGSRPDLERLRQRPRELGLSDEEADLELEMIDASLDFLEFLAATDGARSLPIVETQHKVLGADRCHFAAPMSIDGADESGKLFLTDRRVILLGARMKSVAWPHVSEVSLRDRRLVLARRDGQPAYQPCLNSWSDALRAEAIARALMARGKSQD
jgi:hypothetical protein